MSAPVILLIYHIIYRRNGIGYGRKDRWNARNVKGWA